MFITGTIRICYAGETQTIQHTRITSFPFHHVITIMNHPRIRIRIRSSFLHILSMVFGCVPTSSGYCVLMGWVFAAAQKDGKKAW